MNDYEFNGFEKHPIAAYDPFYTRDHNLFSAAWNDYRRSLRRRLDAAESLKEFNRIMNGFVDTVHKIYAYERATSTHFIGFHDSKGRHRRSASYMDLLDIV